MPSYKPCPDCRTRIKASSTRCKACHHATLKTTPSTAGASTAHKYDTCECGAPKTKTAQKCWGCSYTGSAKPYQPPQIIRTIDAARPTTWWPSHYPPSCPTCNRSGYVRTEHGWHKCGACRGTGRLEAAS